MIKTLIIIYGVILFIFLNYVFLQVFLGLLSFRRDLPKIKEHHFQADVDKDLFYFIIIPCCNEEAVIKNTIQKLCDLEFKGQIIAVDDGSDDDTANQIKVVQSDKVYYLQRTFPNAQTGKGEALNNALSIIEQIAAEKELDLDKVIVGVVDADGELSKNSFSVLNTYFSNSQTIAAQLRVKMYSKFESLLQVGQDAEFFTIINLLQVMRIYTKTVGLSGNGQFFRLQPIIEKIGHQPWGNALLDDYELTLKLMLQKIDIGYLGSAYVYQQALKNTRAFIRQRSRWAQGDLDCLKYLKPILKSSDLTIIQKCGVMLFFAQPWLNFIADLSVFVLLVDSIRRVSIVLLVTNFNRLIINKMLVGILILVITSSFWGVFFTFLYRFDLRRYDEDLPPTKYLWGLPFLIAYMYLILFFSISMAFWRYVRHQSSWIKTKHE